MISFLGMNVSLIYIPSLINDSDACDLDETLTNMGLIRKNLRTSNLHSRQNNLLFYTSKGYQKGFECNQ